VKECGLSDINHAVWIVCFWRMRTGSLNSRVCRQMPANWRLKILRAANGKHVQGQSLRAEFFFGSGMVNFDEREGIVMHAHDVFAFEKVSGSDSVINIHGQVAADTQDGKFEFGCFADELHIQREGGVAGVIKIGIRGLDHETAGAAAVSTIGQGTGMNGIDTFHPAKL
jgi:hypothetical protein